MAGGMIWMLTTMPAATGRQAAGAARGAMASMSRAAMPAPVLAVSILFACPARPHPCRGLRGPSAPGAG